LLGHGHQDAHAPAGYDSNHLVDISTGIGERVRYELDRRGVARRAGERRTLVAAHDREISCFPERAHDREGCSLFPIRNEYRVAQCPRPQNVYATCRKDAAAARFNPVGSGMLTASATKLKDSC
jgi:hypothetical protein